MPGTSCDKVTSLDTLPNRFVPACPKRYKRHVALPNKGRSKTAFAEIDSCWGYEYDYLVVDLVSPEGVQYNPMLLNIAKLGHVALSRSKINLMVVGS